tara:strand:- start:97 stop:240 length:144 start_codon:yes stop_codon:yes gene_type:complete
MIVDTVEVYAAEAIPFVGLIWMFRVSPLCVPRYPSKSEKEAANKMCD